MLVVGYGALLRMDAVAHIYRPVSSPRWLQTFQQTRLGDSVLRPDAMRWDTAPSSAPSAGSPGRQRAERQAYLQSAREMTAFYAARRHEPMFPFATRVWLRVLAGQEVAISFASATFGVLAIVATYLLGAVAFAPWVGLGAAFLFAIEYDLVTVSAQGWRDDAFVCGVLFTALAMIRYMRDPTRPHAVILGLVAGGACLVRLTALSLILPGLLFLVFATGDRWNRGLPRHGIVIGVLLLVLGPFLWNCWRVFGDPFYAIHAQVDARAAAGSTSAAPARPAREAMTSHFANKWRGFDPWLRGIGRWIAWLAIAGLLLFATTREGWLLLVVLAGSLLPHAASWPVGAEWRFTMHAYPFYLIAACVALFVPVREAKRLAQRKRGQSWRPRT